MRPRTFRTRDRGTCALCSCLSRLVSGCARMCTRYTRRSVRVAAASPLAVTAMMESSSLSRTLKPGTCHGDAHNSDAIVDAAAAVVVNNCATEAASLSSLSLSLRLSCPPHLLEDIASSVS